MMRPALAIVESIAVPALATVRAGKPAATTTGSLLRRLASVRGSLRRSARVWLKPRAVREAFRGCSCGFSRRCDLAARAGELVFDRTFAARRLA